MSENIEMTVKEIKITYDALETKWSRMIPDEIADDLDVLHAFISVDPIKAVAVLEDLARKYGDIPALNNYLVVCYTSMGESEKGYKIAFRNYMLFPDYLFAKTAYAQLCLTRGDIEKVKEIFEGAYDIQTLYPDREVFHFSEVLAFMAVWATYYFKKGEYELACDYYHVMTEIKSDHQVTESTRREIAPALFLNKNHVDEALEVIMDELDDVDYEDLSKQLKGLFRD